MKTYKLAFHIITALSFLLTIFYYTIFTTLDLSKLVLGEGYLTIMALARHLNNIFKAELLGYPYKLGWCVLSLLAISVAGIKVHFNSYKISIGKTIGSLIIGILLFFIPSMYVDAINDILKLAMVSIGSGICLYSFLQLRRCFAKNLLKDIFNDEITCFAQQTKKNENRYSINLRTEFIYNKRKRKGWLNITNPFRATALFGLPGSGKSYSIVLAFIKQFCNKGFSMLVYDFKYPTLTEYAYSAFIHHKKTKAKKSYIERKFYIINFDDLKKSHRCNPIDPSLINTISDARQAAGVLIDNTSASANSNSASADFFNKKAKILLTATIWFFKNYQNGIYCTLPHVIELLLSNFKEALKLLETNEDIAPIIREFSSTANTSPAQSAGEISTLTAALEALRDKNSYWVLTGNDFTLDINNPKEPKILCIGNNPARKEAYSPLLALYTSKIMELTNQQGKTACGIIIDELATMKFKDLDDFVATCRSNKIANLFGAQNKLQYDKIYGKIAAESLLDCCANQITGAVAGETAERFSKLVGTRKNIKESFSTNDNKDGENTNTSTNMEQILPSHKIASMHTGHFAAKVAEDDSSPSKGIFFGKVIAEPLEKTYELPSFYPDLTTESIDAHFESIAVDIAALIETTLPKESIEDLFKPKNAN